MSPITHVFAIVAEGRKVPIPANEASSAGGGLLCCVPGKVYKLPWSTYTRRRINAGDLFLSNQGGTKVSTPLEAKASASIKVDADGAVASDQRTDEQINTEAAKAAKPETKGKA